MGPLCWPNVLTKRPAMRNSDAAGWRHLVRGRGRTLCMKLLQLSHLGFNYVLAFQDTDMNTHSRAHTHTHTHTHTHGELLQFSLFKRVRSEMGTKSFSSPTKTHTHTHTHTHTGPRTDPIHQHRMCCGCNNSAPFRLDIWDIFPQIQTKRGATSAD